MGKFFDNLNLVLGVGLVIALALMMGFHAETISAEAVLRWLHVFFGITWIGLLYYFNFVQIPTMPAVPAELKPGVSKYIAPKALFYFRWGAAFTVLTGLILAYVNNYLVEALTLQPQVRLIASACGWRSSWRSTFGRSSGRTSKRCLAWSRQMTQPRRRRAALHLLPAERTPCCRSRCFTQ